MVLKRTRDGQWVEYKPKTSRSSPPPPPERSNAAPRTTPTSYPHSASYTSLVSTLDSTPAAKRLKRTSDAETPDRTRNRIGAMATPAAATRAVGMSVGSSRGAGSASGSGTTPQRATKSPAPFPMSGTSSSPSRPSPTTPFRSQGTASASGASQGSGVSALYGGTSAYGYPYMPSQAASLLVESANGTGGMKTGLSSSSAVGRSPGVPSPAKKRNTAKTKEPVEKRAARKRGRCPNDVMARYERARTQRFFMVDRQRNGDELREEFKVLGSTGNVYTIVIDHQPSCNCPDALKGHTCKHIIFVMTKVLAVSPHSELWYQKALLTSELQQIFAAAPTAPNAVTSPRVRDAYLRATGRAPAKPASEGKAKRKVLEDGDDCPICYEGMKGVEEGKVVWCEECGNGVHGVCWKQWQQSSVRSGKEVTCVYCRAKWPVSAGAGAGAGAGARSGAGSGVRYDEGYLNLAGDAGLSGVRDESSYYAGPRRGIYNGWGSGTSRSASGRYARSQRYMRPYGSDPFAELEAEYGAF